MDQISEARRYVANAKEILRDKAQKDGKYYQDRKYVKMAGHTAYTGILVALDELFHQESRKRKSVDWYKSHIARIDNKLLATFNAAYDTLHLAMSYDGNLSADVARSGLEDAERIIDWVETRTAA